VETRCSSKVCTIFECLVHTIEAYDPVKETSHCVHDKLSKIITQWKTNTPDTVKLRIAAFAAINQSPESRKEMTQD
jgi:hypothetical protein